MPSLSLAGQTLRLLPERCACWEERGALLLADLHLGKSAAYRSAGLPVPEGTTRDDLARLDAAIEKTGAAEIIIVGDLFHAASGQSPEVLRIFVGWRRRHSRLPVRLLLGNHDLKASPPPECELVVAGLQWTAAPLHFVHDPADASSGVPTVCGHLHPAIALPGMPGARAKAPCFWLNGTTLVLPAFSHFTGGTVIRPRPDDSLFAITEGRVHAVPAALLLPPQPKSR